MGNGREDLDHSDVMASLRSEETWHRRFLELAAHVAQWSKDPSTKVGAVIVDSRRLVRSMGYNGFPRGVDDSPERYEDRSLKYPRVVHAEMNAILNTPVPMALEGCKLYVTFPPCSECAKAIIQSGINHVVIPFDPNPEASSRWGESMAVTMSMFSEAGVILSSIKG